jgi:hypothetical protein
MLIRTDAEVVYFLACVIGALSGQIITSVEAIGGCSGATQRKLRPLTVGFLFGLLSLSGLFLRKSVFGHAI